MTGPPTRVVSIAIPVPSWICNRATWSQNQCDTNQNNKCIPFHSDFLLASVKANIRERTPRVAINPDIVMDIIGDACSVDSCEDEAMEVASTLA